MRYRWLVLPLLAILSAGPSGCLASFIVDDFTQPAKTCESFLVQWQGGIAPWTLSVLQAGDDSGAVIEELGTFQGTSFSWDVNVAAGTSVLIQAQDSTGAIAVSEPLDVQAGTTGCALTSASSAPSTSLTTTATTASSSTTSSSTLTTTSSSTTSSSTVSSTSTTSSTVSSIVETGSTTSVATVVATTDGYAVSLSSSSTASASSTNPSSSQSTAAASTLGSTSESNSHTALILGVLIPGLLLVLFLLFMLARRRKRATQVDEESRQPSSAWYMRPEYNFASAQPQNARPVGVGDSRPTSYGVGSTGSYRTESVSSGSPGYTMSLASYPSLGSSNSGGLRGGGA
ncbi:hypothetical protein HMN09_00285500 [Mycena chlorophos]|uniref:Mid2 domain-containing protein n=1 Tax=Mycena chlorophos TaxID=658473 RepID=A0A8H6WI38_MYCCL|nr:hypothetical protein HMN09_00285500 [Mycena chlorophos]